MMKNGWHLIIAFVAVIFTLSACEEVENQVVTSVIPTKIAPTSVAPTSEPVIQKPILVVIEGTHCYSGPGATYHPVSLLNEGQAFEIRGIDDDVTWVDNQGAQIDPNAIIVPDPPSLTLNELVDPEPPHSVRCWVPGSSVETRGDLSSVPIIQLPRLVVIEGANCYSGPGTTYHPVSLLNKGLAFEIRGIDDQDAQIDDDITWFQIDPNAIIDPTPPSSPLNEVIDPDPPHSPLSESDDSCPTFYQMRPRCWVPGSSAETSGDLSGVPVIQLPRLTVVEGTHCYSGPGATYNPVSLLNLDQTFGIIGIDDDIAWIDDDIAWMDNEGTQIDDDIAWFQIDPNAIIDPDPPSSPLNELVDPNPPYSVRCWVPGSSVETSGNLASVPIILKPRLVVVEETNCYDGPGETSKEVGLLNLGWLFRILGIDDVIASMDNDFNWFQIDPNAIIDPVPPSSLLNELMDPDPPHSVRCWVPGGSVETCGDLSILPIIPTATPKPTIEPPPPPRVRCRDFKTANACFFFGKALGCQWDQNKNVCYKP